MEGRISSRKISLFLFLAIIRTSQSDSTENFNEAHQYERKYDLEASHFPTQNPKISEDFYDDLRKNFFDGADGRHQINIQESVKGEVHSWSPKTKRRWAENSMSVWGKRQDPGHATRSSPHWRRMWSENSMAVWGKRMNTAQLKEATDLILSQQAQQRQQNNDISYEIDVTRPETTELNSDLFNQQPEQKRGWAENSMASWGKRVSSKMLMDEPLADQIDMKQASNYLINSHPDQERLLKFLHRKNWEPKRNWATNTMNVWGKRQNQSDKASTRTDYMDIISDQAADV